MQAACITTTRAGGPAPDREPAVNESRAAEMLGVSVRTLQAWRLRGGGPQFLKLGRSVRYRLGDLDVFMQRNVVSSTTEADARRAAHV